MKNSITFLLSFLLSASTVVAQVNAVKNTIQSFPYQNASETEAAITSMHTWSKSQWRQLIHLLNNDSLKLKPTYALSAYVNNVISNSELKKQFEALEAKQLQAMSQQLMQKAQAINGTAFIGLTVQVSNADALKKICTELKLIQPEQVTVLCANIGGKAAVAVSLSDSIVKTKGLDAGKIIKGVYHFANQGETTWFDFAKKIQSVAGLIFHTIAIAIGYHLR